MIARIFVHTLCCFWIASCGSGSEREFLSPTLFALVNGEIVENQPGAIAGFIRYDTALTGGEISFRVVGELGDTFEISGNELRLKAAKTNL